MKLVIVFIIFIALFAESCGQSSNDKQKAKNAVKSKTGNVIKLLEPRLKSNVSLEETLHKRRAVRHFSDEALSFEEISQLLWAAYGLTKENPSQDFMRGGYRTAPSAGALYPLDLYLVAGNVVGLDAGIYKYNSEKHELITFIDKDIRRELSYASSIMVETAPATIVYTAVFNRTTKKYGERGRFRYVPIDLGHSAQNVHLQAVALGLATCPIGAFNDEDVKTAMKLNELEEPLFFIPIGKSAK